MYKSPDIVSAILLATAVLTIKENNAKYYVTD